MSIISTDLTPFQIDDTLKAALREDVHSEDYSTNAIFDPRCRFLPRKLVF